MTFIEAVKELELKHPETCKPVTPRELIDILKEDVVYAVTRPGSWEGSNMLIVLQCHGFFLHQ
jgi:hypothetical protein